MSRETAWRIGSGKWGATLHKKADFRVRNCGDGTLKVLWRRQDEVDCGVERKSWSAGSGYDKGAYVSHISRTTVEA